MLIGNRGAPSLSVPLRVICGANKRPVRPRVYRLDVYPNHATYFNMGIRSKPFAAKALSQLRVYALGEELLL